MSEMKWLKAIDPIVDDVTNAPWESEEFYRTYLSQIYYFVSWSTRMLAAAASVTGSSGYYARLIEHLKEESGHEKMALADLKAMGGSISDYEELGVTRALWEPQFYKVQRTPTALLGYIIALEMVAVKVYPDLMTKLESRYGRKAVTFVRVHGTEDPDHVDKAVEQIAMLPPSEQAAVIANFEQTCSILRFLMAEVRASASRRSEDARKRNRAA